MSTWRIVRIVVVSAIALSALGWLTRAPYDPLDGDRALLRLSWRFRPEPSETCRPRTQAELDQLPVHMRTPEICTPQPVVYRVIRSIDDSRPDTIPVLRGGLKHDRPVYVLLDTALVPATYRIRVSLTRERDGAPPELVLQPLDTVLEMKAGEVRLVTLNGGGRVFVVREPGDVPAAPN